jgi:hypothetical protein
VGVEFDAGHAEIVRAAKGREGVFEPVDGRTAMGDDEGGLTAGRKQENGMKPNGKPGGGGGFIAVPWAGFVTMVSA